MNNISVVFLQVIGALMAYARKNPLIIVYWKRVAALISIVVITLIALILLTGNEVNAADIPHAISSGEQCLTCHTTASIPTGDHCLSCHALDGIRPEPQNHADFAESICLSCHSSGGGSIPETPRVPHNVSWGQNCLDCHAIDGIEPSPVSHTTFEGSTCLSCHSLSEDPGSLAPAVTHRAYGREQCWACHSAQGIDPAPANHTTLGENVCGNCHSYSTELPLSNSCLNCHEEPKLGMTLSNGEWLPLNVEPALFSKSIHGNKLLCTDCHSSISGYPHPGSDISSRRDYKVAQYELCNRCHFDNYTKTLDSVHYKVLSEGNLNSPLCTDCHGAHYVSLPYLPRTLISDTCSNCHKEIYDAYSESVHGSALVEDNNYDVPVCTSCHSSHNIEDARTTDFHLASVEICNKCHSNAKLMEKYGISTNVSKTYLDDFHGRTATLVEKEGSDIGNTLGAICTDCHGIHDIQTVEDPNSSVIKGNLIVTCRKCHPGATENFSGAWLSHYEPSIHKAPLVLLAKWFYKILIPFMVVGISVHVLLDLWRLIIKR